jgi:hypothetical protein
MGANSNHYGDILIWLKGVVESCKTREQCRTCDKLLDNFNNMFPHIDTSDVRDLQIRLIDLEFSFIDKKING